MVHAADAEHGGAGAAFEAFAAGTGTGGALEILEARGHALWVVLVGVCVGGVRTNVLHICRIVMMGRGKVALDGMG